MARFDFRRFIREDFIDAPEWLNRVFIPLNVALEQIKSALTNNLTFDENIRSSIVQVAVQTKSDYTPDASGTAGWTPINLSLSSRFQARGVLIMNAVEDAANYSPITASSVTWRQLSPDQITILYVGGLKPASKYTITLLVI